MTTKSAYGEACLLPIMNGQILRKVVSDVSSEIDKLGKELETILEIDEVMKEECNCCGLQEECTKEYILQVKNSYSGKWVCGLCSEAVKERLNRIPKTAIEEALSTHRSFCQEFNSKTRLNPKLSFTCTMREIAKRKYESRKNNPCFSKIARTSSCVPRLL
ncbi:hypothetical protein ACH5RR_041241 [Cinchona calisaya]|uniref:DUF1677 family protein n=1 Tax=Cinchona calisaya TaxID=153742 RepID=A0ABD2XTA1_9GENT